MRERFRRAWTAAPFAIIVSAAASCYGTNLDPCHYHYGYYYPYCDYEYFEPYTPTNGYEPVVVQELRAEPTPHPSPSIAPKMPDDVVRLRSYIYMRRDSDTGDTPADERLNSDYPCGLGELGFTLCGTPTLRARDTDYIVIGAQTENTVPTNDAVNFLVLGFAFDGDDDPTNNFVPADERLNDYFGQTDQWYAASYVPSDDPEDGWTLRAFRLDTNGQPVEFESEARVILQEDSAVLIVPADEFLAATPGNRISLFRHAGDEGFGADGNWSAFVHPPLGEPLAGL